jgi:hypothetical protein
VRTHRSISLTSASPKETYRKIERVKTRINVASSFHKLPNTMCISVFCSPEGNMAGRELSSKRFKRSNEKEAEEEPTALLPRPSAYACG